MVCASGIRFLFHCSCRFHNKGVYVKVGLQKLSHTRNLHKDIRLQVDKQDVELPSIEGLIFLNIPRYPFHTMLVKLVNLSLLLKTKAAVCVSSWGSGADLWGSDSESRFGRPRIDDGMLEVVGVTGVVHMVGSDALFVFLIFFGHFNFKNCSSIVVWQGFVMFLTRLFYSHQVCVYLIKNTVKKEILW